MSRRSIVLAGLAMIAVAVVVGLLISAQLKDGSAAEPSPSPSPQLTAEESAMLDWYAGHVDALQKLVDEVYAAAETGATLASMESDATYVAERLTEISNEFFDEVDGGLVGGKLSEVDGLWTSVTVAVAEGAKVMLTIESAGAAEQERAARLLAQAVSDVGSLRAEIERLQEMQ